MNYYRDDVLTLIVWNVQHGSAVFIRTPNNTCIVQDLGTGMTKDGEFITSPLLHISEVWGINELDAVIVTHPHKDHLEDILTLDRFNVKRFFRPSKLTPKDVMKTDEHKEDPYIKKYFKLDRARKYKKWRSQSHKVVEYIGNKGVFLETFSPNRCSPSTIDNHSLVTVLHYAGRKIVLPGDNRSPSLDELLEHEDFVYSVANANILLAPHHGRRSSCHDHFMDLCSPDLTIISDKSHENSARPWYGRRSSWNWVYSRSRGKIERRCLTTRKDGTIMVQISSDGLYTEID